MARMSVRLMRDPEVMIHRMSMPDDAAVCLFEKGLSVPHQCTPDE